MTTKRYYVAARYTRLGTVSLLCSLEYTIKTCKVPECMELDTPSQRGGET